MGDSDDEAVDSAQVLRAKLVSNHVKKTTLDWGWPPLVYVMSFATKMVPTQ